MPAAEASRARIPTCHSVHWFVRRVGNKHTESIVGSILKLDGGKWREDVGLAVYLTGTPTRAESPHASRRRATTAQAQAGRLPSRRITYSPAIEPARSQNGGGRADDVDCRALCCRAPGHRFQDGTACRPAAVRAPRPRRPARRAFGRRHV